MNLRDSCTHSAGLELCQNSEARTDMQQDLPHVLQSVER